MPQIPHLVRRASNDRVEVKFFEAYFHMMPNIWLNEEQDASFFVLCPVRQKPDETADQCLARAHRLAREYNIIGQTIRERAGDGQ